MIISVIVDCHLCDWQRRKLCAGKPDKPVRRDKMLKILFKAGADVGIPDSYYGEYPFDHLLNYFWGEIYSGKEEAVVELIAKILIDYSAHTHYQILDRIDYLLTHGVEKIVKMVCDLDNCTWLTRMLDKTKQKRNYRLSCTLKWGAGFCSSNSVKMLIEAQF